MLDLGKIMITPEGEWKSDKTYEYLSLVFHNNGGYVAKKDNANVEPGTDDDIWMFLGQTFRNTYNRLQAELYAIREYHGAPRLFMRAKPGMINPLSDTFVFARCKSINVREFASGVTHYRRKGWIRPHPHNGITLRYEKINGWPSGGEWEYFEIKPSVSKLSYFYAAFHVEHYDRWDVLANNIEDYLADETERYQRGDEHHEGSIPAKLNQRCGICIERDGVQMTEYMPFRLLASGKTTVGHSAKPDGWGPTWGFKIG